MGGGWGKCLLRPSRPSLRRPSFSPRKGSGEDALRNAETLMRAGRWRQACQVLDEYSAAGVGAGASPRGWHTSALHRARAKCLLRLGEEAEARRAVLAALAAGGSVDGGGADFQADLQAKASAWREFLWEDTWAQAR